MGDTFMRCGCAAQGTIGNSEKPICLVHDCVEPASAPDLSGRYAICSYGPPHGRVPSKLSLAFFVHHPDDEEDRYYCGCYGWD